MLAGFDGDIFAVKPLSKLKTKHTVRQAYEESCGAAALATLFRLYGKDTNETQILEEVDKSDMLSFEELGRISLKFGFLTDGYKINRSVFEKIRIPILALVVREADFPHFVIVVNHEGDFVEVFDPSFGDYVSSKRDFYDMWEFASGGYALIAAPTATYQRRDLSSLLSLNVFMGK